VSWAAAAPDRHTARTASACARQRACAAASAGGVRAPTGASGEAAAIGTHINDIKCCSGGDAASEGCTACAAQQCG
jgi:hypothetical protein